MRILAILITRLVRSKEYFQRTPSSAAIQGTIKDFYLKNSSQYDYVCIYELYTEEVLVLFVLICFVINLIHPTRYLQDEYITLRFKSGDKQIFGSRW